MLCPSCGWEFPDIYDERFCKWCGQLLRPLAPPEPPDKTAPIEERYLYAKEHVRVGNTYRDKETAEAIWIYETLVDINKMPYKPLTEDDWIKACSHFNGCAFCWKPEISTRFLLIPAKEHGRYTKYNVLPLCEKCMLVKRIGNTVSMLKAFNPAFNLPLTKARGWSIEKRTKAILYLFKKAEEDGYDILKSISL